MENFAENKKRMSNFHKFKPTDKMSNVISRNYSLISVMSRFGMSLGFGEKTVKEVCDNQNVDCGTFLAVVNFVDEDAYGGEYIFDEDSVSLPALMEYLKQAHSYFLDFSLPTIRMKLCEALDQEPEKNDITQSILMFYDKYVEEVRRHMEYENKHIFQYVDNLLEGKRDNNFSIQNFAERHSHIDQKLAELKNIIIKYYPQSKCNNLLNASLFDIFNCESDLRTHCRLEDLVFTPTVARLESKLRNEE